jgi:hypothetical protein
LRLDQGTPAMQADNGASPIIYTVQALTKEKQHGHI